MADFCYQCSMNFFREDFKDLHGLVTEEQYKRGLVVKVLCEGCGPTEVNHRGVCVSKHCTMHNIRHPDRGKLYEY